MMDIVIVSGLVVYFLFLAILFINSFAAFALPISLFQIGHLVLFTSHQWMLKLKMAGALLTVNVLVAFACTGVFLLFGQSAWKSLEQKLGPSSPVNLEYAGIALGGLVISAISLFLYLKLLQKMA